MPSARVNGIEMYYEEVGAGEPLALIMGFGGDHLAWAFQARVFAERYRVVTFDNRGAGQTDDGPGDTTVRPCRPELRPLLEAEREKLRKYGALPPEPPPAADAGNGKIE